jgi:opacity protein-like surface antigen
MNAFENIWGITCASVLLGVFLQLPGRAQVVPAAIGPGKSLWVGAEFSDFSASFPYQSGQRIQGIGAFADLHLKPRLGIEGDAQFMNLGGFEGSTENTYLAGPRMFVLSSGKLQLFGKGLVGVATIHYPFQIGNANYLAIGPGGGVEWRLDNHWMLRAEYEYQFWPNSPGYANLPDHPLTPNGFRVGIAYRVFR